MHIDPLVIMIVVAALTLLASVVVLAACARSSQISERERHYLRPPRYDVQPLHRAGAIARDMRKPYKRQARKVSK